MRRPFAILAVLALAGCGVSQGLEKRLMPDTQSLGDRCFDIMKRAMPFADLELGGVNAHGVDVRTIVAQVSATRTDMANNEQVSRDLGVECTFTDSVMTGFRWTQGGPAPAPAPPAPHASPELPPSPPSTQSGH